MSNLYVIFLTGLTTGGLSCLAVQGGMLASSLAGQSKHSAEGLPSRGEEFEQAVAKINAQSLSKKRYLQTLARLKQKYPVVQPEAPQVSARPIVLFLAAKLVAYTILGAALGWLGSMLQLTPLMRGVLQVAIGLFMLATAGRLLNAHPIFRHTAIEPPKFVRSYIRRRTKAAGDNWLAPVFLGALTVLIPCGVTQAMMALAVASGNPFAGAALMFAFVLGTTPLFFTLAYLATKLGARWQDKFWKVAGVLVLVLGLMAVDGGLNILGSPITSGTIGAAIADKLQADGQAGLEAQSQGVPVVEANASNELAMTITDSAYSPAVMQVKAGVPIKLTVTTQDVSGCGRSMVIPSLGIQKLFASSGQEVLEIPAQPASRIRLTCTMGMYNAQIVVK